jgi:hypothetical protein
MPRAATGLFALVKAAEGEFKRVDTSEDAVLDVVGLQAINVAMDRMDQIFGIFYTVHKRRTIIIMVWLKYRTT